FFSSRRRHTRFSRDWSSDVCSSDLGPTDSPNPEPTLDTTTQGQVIEEEPQDKGSVPNTGHPLHRLCQSGTNLSDSSLDSEALLRSEERRVGKECRSGWVRVP